jgi:hypothetical protein
MSEVYIGYNKPNPAIDELYSILEQKDHGGTSVDPIKNENLTIHFSTGDDADKKR